MSAPAAALEFHGITKRFFGVPVLEDLTLALGEGRVLGLVGENGAGKSTLMNVLGGVFPPDGGSMRLAGEPYAPGDPREAARRGVAFIHQELNLFPNLSVAENLCMPAFPRLAALPWIDRRELRRRAGELLAPVDLDVPPETLVEDLSQGERQLIEIARALGLRARLIIFDEPTTSLAAREAETLFGMIERLRARGITMIYISHNLGDVLRLCDDIAVLRDGRLVASGPARDSSPDTLITLMVGRRIEEIYPARTSAPSVERTLEARSLSQPGVIEDVGFGLHRGEVLGIFGLMGSGRTELARVLFGIDPCARGEVRVNGEVLLPWTPGECVRRGMAYMPEDRRHEGLLMEAPAAENIALAYLRSFSLRPLGILRRRRLDEAVSAAGRSLDIRGDRDRGQPVKTLSGGNQQKVILARWLLERPSVFILDEPTRGIDVGARHEIYRILDSLAANGAGVLFISSEIEELLGTCDRILVMHRGELVEEVSRDAFDRERLLRACHGMTSPQRGRANGREARREDEEVRGPKVPAAMTAPRTESTAGKRMPGGRRSRRVRALLGSAPYIALGLLLVGFGAASPTFLTAANLKHILIQSAPVAIAATGMTFVLLTAGIDLSVGAVMFLAAAIAAKLVLAGFPVAVAMSAVTAIGILYGALNAFCVVRLGVAPFIVTLATWHFGRGLALWITQTRAINLPESILELGTGRLLGIPVPLIALGIVLPAAHLLLTRTPFGRQVLAVGHDREAARRAGIRTGRILAAVYMISGACAVLGGMVALGQLGSVSPTFGEKRELEAIAVAVIGGASLFGGRGNVLPGALLGAVLLGSIYNGLVMVGANPYIFPLVTAGIILLAVLVDSLRAHRLRMLGRRKIRPEKA